MEIKEKQLEYDRISSLNLSIIRQILQELKDHFELFGMPNK